MQELSKLLSIMRALRDPESGCPWDLEQDLHTIVPHTIEEAYEVAAAIEAEDMDDLRAELGDLLFQVVFYTQLTAEKGLFDFAAVAQAICEKLVRRHPHVFGDEVRGSASDQTKRWEAIKASERAAGAQGETTASAVDDIPLQLPALVRAQKMQHRAARVGFDWSDPAAVREKIAEELAELDAARAAREPADRIEDELGDVLFSCVNLARHLSIDAETALRRATTKFERRFRAVEHALAANALRAEDVGLEELERLWVLAKAREQ